MLETRPAAAVRATEVTDSSPCEACGACCAYSADWPRFSTEDEDTLSRLPLDLVANDGSGMRCIGARCAALIGAVGVATSCSVYADRPDVCRACEVGDDACRMARRKFGLETLAV